MPPPQPQQQFPPRSPSPDRGEGAGARGTANPVSAPGAKRRESSPTSYSYNPVRHRSPPPSPPHSKAACRVMKKEAKEKKEKSASSKERRKVRVKRQRSASPPPASPPRPAQPSINARLAELEAALSDVKAYRDAVTLPRVKAKVNRALEEVDGLKQDLLKATTKFADVGEDLRAEMAQLKQHLAESMEAKVAPVLGLVTSLTKRMDTLSAQASSASASPSAAPPPAVEPPWKHGAYWNAALLSECSREQAAPKRRTPSSRERGTMWSGAKAQPSHRHKSKKGKQKNH